MLWFELSSRWLETNVGFPLSCLFVALVKQNATIYVLFDSFEDFLTKNADSILMSDSLDFVLTVLGEVRFRYRLYYYTY